MNVLHLSTSDTNGGAARAAFRLHTGLRKSGINSNMLVLKRSGPDPSVTPLRWSNDLLSRLKRRSRRRAIQADFARYKNTRPKDLELFADDRTEVGHDLVRQLNSLPRPDIINLHWVANFVDWQLLLPHLPADVPIVWRLADMGPLTGGCHYDLNCGKFTANCGACPQLGSNQENDLSRQVWIRKHQALAAMTNPMHVVGPSRWTAEQARRSSLFSRFPVSVIPNGLDTTVFSPRDKGFCRDLLGVPRDARVVLFAAEQSANKRKGFEYLASALPRIQGIDRLFLLSVGGGNPNVPGLNQLHLGKIHDDRMLSVVYSAADVFVIPSVQESFGQTVTESMACGTPVAGFDAGGIPDMVRRGITGRLAAVGNADALADAISKVLTAGDGWKTLSENCRRIAVQEYSMEIQARAYGTLYNSLRSTAPD